MKIKYCNDNFLEVLKADFDKYIEIFINKDEEKLNEIISNGNILEGNVEFRYIQLKNSENSNNPERDNIKIIRETLGHLKPVQATEEKLWVAMYLTYYREHFFEYVNKVKSVKKYKEKIKSALLFTHGVNRSLIVHNLARLWWLGYYLYDSENKSNPYELLDFYTNSKDIIGKSTVFFSSNLTSNRQILFGILEGIKYLTEQDEISNVRKYYIEINRYFNSIGGVQLLDFLTREEVRIETIRYIRDNMYKF